MKKKAQAKTPIKSMVPDHMDDLVEWISSGKTLREFCRQDGRPAWRTVYDYLEKDKPSAARFAHARALGEDAIAEETLALLDADPERCADGKIDPGYVKLVKERADIRLKLLAKWNPKKWGDRVQQEVSGPNGGPIQNEVRPISAWYQDIKNDK